MVDQMFDREYQAGRSAMNSDLDRGMSGFVSGLRAGFELLNRIQWSAPWNAPAPRNRPKRRGLA
jgi:hypothetical protein